GQSQFGAWLVLAKPRITLVAICAFLSAAVAPTRGWRLTGHEANIGPVLGFPPSSPPFERVWADLATTRGAVRHTLSALFQHQLEGTRLRPRNTARAQRRHN
ncbi:hypothetical protein V8C35DRAFT_310424, partial [Trichoderma chlorosporum]